MKTKQLQRLLSLSILVFAPSLVNATSTTVTVNGVTYTVTLSSPQSFSSYSSTLQAQTIWGDANLAYQFVIAVGTTLGTPNYNGTGGPGFAYDTNGANAVIYYKTNQGISQNYVPFSSSFYWALISLGGGTDAVNTLSTVQQNASGLAATFNTQAAALQAGLTYDCNTFDENGLCASAGGRMTYAGSSPFGNQQAGLVIISHKPSPYFRFGGFADQSVATATPNGIKQSNSGPMYGFFGYWNNQKDGMGLGASVTTSFSNNNLAVSRSNALANTEAGSGTTQMQGQGIQGQLTYALQASDRIRAIPYLGMRYYRVAAGGYTEGSSTDVTSPLTYNAMSQTVLAAVGGMGAQALLAEKLTGTASIGLQQNLNYKMGNYQGTSSISGLETFSVKMPSNTNTMATATAGLNYALTKNEKLGLNVLWQQQAYTATNTVTALATYSIGF